MSAHVNPPSRDEVTEKLRQLIAGTLSPKAASAWASPWLSRFDEISDKRVKRSLENLGMADLPSTDRDYLYGRADFEAWLRDLADESR